MSQCFSLRLCVAFLLWVSALQPFTVTLTLLTWNLITNLPRHLLFLLSAASPLPCSPVGLCVTGRSSIKYLKRAALTMGILSIYLTKTHHHCYCCPFTGCLFIQQITTAVTKYSSILWIFTVFTLFCKFGAATIPSFPTCISKGIWDVHPSWVKGELTTP